MNTQAPNTVSTNTAISSVLHNARSSGSDFSLGPATTSSTDTSFCASNFYPSILAVLGFGFINCLLSFAIQAGTAVSTISGLIMLAHSFICYQWFDLHGPKMTRREHIYFDEKNLLATTDRLDYNLPPVTEDLTPGGIPEARKSVLGHLFRNEKDEEMQKWYKQHYGPVYETAMRCAKQERMMANTAKDAGLKSPKNK